jgi:hypothetical protein
VAGDHGEVWTGSRADEPRPMMRVPDGKFGPGGPLSVYMTYRDPDGAIWISARNSFLRWRGASFTEIQPPEAMKKMHRSPTRDPMIVSSVTRDSVGNLWVAYGGLGEFQLSQGAWKHVDVLSDHPNWASMRPTPTQRVAFGWRTETGSLSWTTVTLGRSRPLKGSRLGHSSSSKAATIKCGWAASGTGISGEGTVPYTSFSRRCGTRFGHGNHCAGK